MAKAIASIILDERKAKLNGTYPVKLRVYHNYTTKLFGTRWDLTVKKFEESYKAVRPRDASKILKQELIALETKANDIINTLDPFTFKEFARKLTGKSSDNSDLFVMFDDKIKSLLENNQISTASSYKSAMDSLRKFISSEKGDTKNHNGQYPRFSVSSITSDFLKKYGIWMSSIGNSETTIGFYVRNLRAIYNAAKKNRIILTDRSPFEEYKIPSGNFQKTYLNKEEVSKLFNTKIETEAEQKALDFFILSYLSNGMNFKDILELKGKNIKVDTLAFVRSKTQRTTKRSKMVRVSLSRIQQEIIQKYSSREYLVNSNAYVFPVFTPGMTPSEKQKATQNFIRTTNKNLKKIAKAASIGKNISTYTARHSFTTNAIRSGASMEYVSESLGHNSMYTTQQYWSGFDDSVKRDLTNKLEQDLQNGLES